MSAIAKRNSPPRPAPAKREDWGQLGPAMRALPNDAWREFVHAFVTCPLKPSKRRPGFIYGRQAYAARKAGFGKQSDNGSLGRLAYKLSGDERILAAIDEETKKYLRRTLPEAVPAFQNLIRDPTHKDHGRAVLRAIDAIDPIVTHQNIAVTHKIVDPDTEALEELRALRQIGASREKLIELFGGNGLARLERLEAADISRRAAEAKIIDGEVIEANG